MNVELSNGLDHFFQWDKGQKVKIPDGAPTVHFKWGNIAVPFDVVDGWVEIAPELTQKPGDILLWTYKEDHTLDAARIPVERKPKPADYAYTPTEVKTWEQLDERIKALEAANVQANWDQSDDSAADYVRGRTHYVGTKHDVRVIKQTSGKFSPELGLIVGNTYRVDYDRGSGFGVGEEFVCKDLNEGKDGIEPAPYVGNADGSGGPNPYLIFYNSIKLHAAFAHMVNIVGWKIEGDFADIKTLDTKYLDPGLLARIQKLEDGAGMDITGAKVGQMVRVKAADETGKPTAWETIDGYTGQVTADKVFDPDHETDLVQYAAFRAAVPGVQMLNISGASAGQIPQIDTVNSAGNPTAWKAVDALSAGDLSLGVTGATVGQTVKIAAVDDNGVPTAWVPVDMASGGGAWEKLYDGTMQIEQETMAVEVDMPRNDSAKEFRIYLHLTKNVAQAWADAKNISVKINGAQCGYFTFMNKLASDYYVFAKREFDSVERMEYATATVKPNYNVLGMFVQLVNGSGYEQKNNGKISISFASSYAGSIELLVYGRY